MEMAPSAKIKNICLLRNILDVLFPFVIKSQSKSGFTQIKFLCSDVDFSKKFFLNCFY